MVSVVRAAVAGWRVRVVKAEEVARAMISVLVEGEGQGAAVQRVVGVWGEKSSMGPVRVGGVVRRIWGGRVEPRVVVRSVLEAWEMWREVIAEASG